MKIPFVDLRSQYEQLKPQINARIDQVLEHGAYVMGPEIAELECQLSEYCNVKHAITCSSGTDALLLGLMAYDVGPGDAVFTTPFTFFATAEAIALVGATPIFVDIDHRTFNIDPERLEEAIRRVNQSRKLRSRGILPVNLFGLPANYDQIDPLAREHALFVLEDAAQSFGAKHGNQASCSLGDISATSFFPAKPLGCYGDGGAVFTNDDALAEKILSIRIHGMGQNKYDNVRIGLNARMDSIQAAVLLVKLGIFDDELKKRRHLAEAYDQCLRDLVETPFTPDGMSSSWAQFSVLSDHREIMIGALAEQGIPVQVYYRIPCHLSRALGHLGYKPGDFPVTEEVSSRIFSLPMHPYLDDGIAARIRSVLQDVLHGVSRTVG
ncbi:MAG: DegT/DnrJ/EryC1/StrS aminotransferase family protein [Gammaproteobacteria bacterium]|nr:DegT/DnrJ/EryC1/StrS aminotransferase family protein [Gammaproteobacteria bacterium]